MDKTHVLQAPGIKHLGKSLLLLFASLAIVLSLTTTAAKAQPSARSSALVAGTVLIEAGGTANYTDPNGDVWLADAGFTAGAGGVVDRGNIAIANTTNDRIYQTERWGQTAFTYAVPNGAYQVKLHFAETYAGITGAGQRVFNANVEGVAINNIDVFGETGGANRALVKTVNVTVADGAMNVTFAATVNNTLINGIEIIPTSPTAVRIEAGGAANYTDPNGNLWLADTGFTAGAGGVVDRGNIAIANTTNDRIYQTERWGQTAFAYAVQNGAYQVSLHFAETYAGITAAGQRVFSANVEGVAVNNIDVFAETGGLNRALVKTVNVTVADGVLNVTFAATANNPLINGIEIIPGTAAPTSTPTATATNTVVPPTNTPTLTPTATNTPVAAAVRIEAGGAANYTDPGGNLWLADAGFTAGAGGVVDRGNIAIANTTNDRIYQTERWGMTAFAYTIPNGTYQVNLHLAETYWTAAGQRVFSATVEGSPISNIDIIAQAGAANTALVKSACVTVADGQLSIAFTATVDQAAINGIEIIPAANCPTPTITPTPSITPTSQPVTGNTISPLLVGNNVWLDPSDAVWTVSGQAGLKLMRIGGIEYDENFPSYATLNTWVGKIKAMGAEPMMQVSRYRTAQQAADVVYYFNVQTNNKIKYWNIGNEPSCGSDTTATAGMIAGYTKSLAAAMKAVDPTILIFGPDSCDYGDVVYGQLFKGDNSANDVSGKVPGKSYYYVDGVSWHRYVGYGPEYIQISGLTTAGAQDYLTRVQKTRILIDNANAAQGRTGASALQWGIGEFNGSDGARTCSYENGQMFAEVYGYLMKYKATYGLTWAMQEGGGGAECGAGTTDFSFVGRDNKPRATFYHMQMISQNFSGVYLDGTSNLTGVRSYGAIDTAANKIVVMLLNIETTGQRTCTVRLNSTALTAGDCRINIPAGVSVDYNKTIGAQTSVVLVFNLQGQLVKTITYSIANKNAGTAPTVTMP